MKNPHQIVVLATLTLSHSNPKRISQNEIKNLGGEIKRQYKYIPVITAKLPEKAVTTLSKNPNIDYIEQDTEAYATSQVIPWGIPHVKATEAQDSGYSGQGIKVGIIDTGIDYAHEDLNVTGGISFIDGTNAYFDDNGHGTHVTATGNNGYAKKGTITYPAAYDSVIAVGAIDQNNIRASFSSVGRQLELMAPGVNILSTVPNNSYDSYNGTSMASPHVAGVAALVWEAKPNLTNVQLRNLLNETATSLGDSFEYGNGLKVVN